MAEGPHGLSFGENELSVAVQCVELFRLGFERIDEPPLMDSIHENSEGDNATPAGWWGKDLVVDWEMSSSICIQGGTSRYVWLLLGLCFFACCTVQIRVEITQRHFVQDWETVLLDEGFVGMTQTTMPKVEQSSEFVNGYGMAGG